MAQYTELKKGNNNGDIDVGEILLIIGSITGGLLILIIGIAVAFFLIVKIIEKFESFEFSSNAHQTNYNAELTTYGSIPVTQDKQKKILNNFDSDSIKKIALDFVSNDQPKEAINYLLDRETVLKTDVLDSIRLNSSKLTELNKNKHLDLISNQEYSLQKSKINNSLIQTIKEIK